MTNRTEWFSEIEPYHTGRLRVSDVHELYYEQCGNPDGLPIVFLHGGPGSGCNPKHRRYFDPEKFHITLFDQRGAGRSTPRGDLTDNTIPHLVEDIERLRRQLGLDAWYVCGSSFGSALALCYALTNPKRVLGMVCSGTFLAEHNSSEWLREHGGAQRFFPEEFIRMVHFLPPDERPHVEESFETHILQGAKSEATAAARALLKWEGALCGMEINRKEEETPKTAEEITAEDDFLRHFARIQLHYEKNHFFIDKDYILKNIQKLQNIPIHFVHGRYDLVCPLDNAWRLHKKLPNSSIQIVPEAGHSNSEMIAELTCALSCLGTDKKPKRLCKRKC